MEVFFLFIIVVSVVVFLVYKHNQRVNEAWMDAASKLRLNYENSGGGSRKIRGNRVDLALVVRPKTVGKATFTEYEAEFHESLPHSLRLKPQTAFSDVANVFLNRIDIETGDPQFDGRVVIESQNAEWIRDILTDELRQSITAIMNRFNSFEVTEHNITLQRNQLVSDPRKLIEDIRTLEAAARLIFRTASPEPSNSEEAPVRVPPPLPDRSREPEEVAENNESPTANAAESSSEVPVDVSSPILSSSPEEELPSLEEGSDFPFEIALEEKPEETEPAQQPTDAFSILCLDTFRKCRGRYDFQQTFEKELKGQDIGGSALLRKVEPYSMDRIFGRGPGIRRTFSIGKLENGDDLLLVANSPIDAEISTLRAEENSPVSFEGSLVASDPFENTLYLRVPETREGELTDAEDRSESVMHS